MHPESLRSANLDETTRRSIEACAEVHRRLGPGLAAEAYLEALCHELTTAGLAHQRRLLLPVFYRGIRLDAAYQLDVCVAGAVVIDVRALPALGPLQRAELRARLRVSGLDSGVLVNFNTARFGDGLVVLRRAAPQPRLRGFVRDLSLLDQSTVELPPGAAAAASSGTAGAPGGAPLSS